MEFRLANVKKTSRGIVECPENECRIAGFKKFRDNLAIYQYHTLGKIKEIMVTQVERIAVAFEYIEDRDWGAENYPKQDIGNKWRRFMKRRHDTEIARLEAWLDKWANNFRNQEFKSNFKRSTPSPSPVVLFTRAKNNKVSETGSCKKEPDEANLKKRLDLLMEVYDNRVKWENPIEAPPGPDDLLIDEMDDLAEEFGELFCE
jgi:hypothetical protein